MCGMRDLNFLLYLFIYLFIMKSYTQYTHGTVEAIQWSSACQGLWTSVGFVSHRCNGGVWHGGSPVICVLLSMDNSQFLVTDLQQLAEGHSLSLARQLGTVSRRTWMITHSIWTLLNVSLNHFCSRCTDNAFSALEISSKW